MAPLFHATEIHRSSWLASKTEPIRKTATLLLATPTNVTSARPKDFSNSIPKKWIKEKIYRMKIWFCSTWRKWCKIKFANYFFLLQTSGLDVWLVSTSNLFRIVCFPFACSLIKVSMAWQALFDFEEKKRKVILRMVCWLLKSPNLSNEENTYGLT